MKIRWVLWHTQFVEKIERKHSLTVEEVEDVLYGGMRVRRLERGKIRDEDLYLGLGRSSAGRYISVFFVLKAGGVAMPISARDMNRRERRMYGRG